MTFNNEIKVGIEIIGIHYKTPVERINQLNFTFSNSHTFAPQILLH